MFPGGSIEDVRKSFLNGNLTDVGIWSVLLTPDMSDAADFARRYFADFNEKSQAAWHLKVFAKATVNKEQPGAPIQWHADKDMFEQSQKIRRDLDAAGAKLPGMCIVFMDSIHPPSKSPSWAVLPLDEAKLSNSVVFLRGLEVTRECVRKAYKDLGLEMEKPLGEADSKALIERLQSQLRKANRSEKTSAYVIKPTAWAVQSVLSALLGLPFSNMF